MLCYFHSWNSSSHSVPLLPSHMTYQRWGWAGQVVLAGRNHREQGVEQCCPAGWGELWSSCLTSVKQVSGSRLGPPEGNTEFLHDCKTLKAGNWNSWADQILLKSEKWQCWEEKGRLKASVGICGKRGQDEVAVLCLCRHHGNEVMPTVLPRSLSWAPGTLRVGDREWNYLFAQMKGNTKSCRREMRRKDAWRALLPSEGNSVLGISFSSSFRSLAELGWQRPSAPLACSFKKPKKIPLFSQHGQISMVDRDQVFKMLEMEGLKGCWDFLAAWGSPKLCAIS